MEAIIPPTPLLSQDEAYWAREVLGAPDQLSAQVGAPDQLSPQVGAPGQLSPQVGWPFSLALLSKDFQGPPSDSQPQRPSRLQVAGW